jgi:hypothetical protein
MSDIQTIINMYNHIITRHPDFHSPETFQLVIQMFHTANTVSSVDEETGKLAILEKFAPEQYKYVMELKENNPNITHEEITKKLNEKFLH